MLSGNVILNGEKFFGNNLQEFSFKEIKNPKDSWFFQLSAQMNFTPDSGEWWFDQLLVVQSL